MILKIEMNTDDPCSTVLSIDGKRVAGIESVNVYADINSDKMSIHMKGKRRETRPDSKTMFCNPIETIDKFVYGRLFGPDETRTKTAAEFLEAFKDSLAKK